MKASLFVTALLAFVVQPVTARDPGVELIEADRGPHHATFLRVTSERAPDGRLSSRTNAGYVVLGDLDSKGIDPSPCPADLVRKERGHAFQAMFA